MDEKFTITHKELLNFFGEIKKDLITEVKAEVKAEVKTTVNGKMDKMDIKINKLISDGEEREKVQTEHSTKLDEIQNKITPVLEDRRDVQGAKKKFLLAINYIVGGAAIIGAWSVIKNFFIK